MVQLAGEDDLQDVRSAVADLAGSWKDLGISLGIQWSKLDAIKSTSPSECLTEMLALWLKQNYNVRTTPIRFLIYYTNQTSFVTKGSSLEKSPMPMLKNVSSFKSTHHCAQLT